MSSATKPVEQKARELVARLDKRIQDQRERGGDYLDYGRPNPFDVELRDFLAALNTDGERIRRLEDGLRRAANVFDSYAEMHRSKLSPMMSDEEKTAITDKVRRNHEHARDARSLSTPSKGVG